MTFGSLHSTVTCCFCDWRCVRCYSFCTLLHCQSLHTFKVDYLHFYLQMFPLSFIGNDLHSIAKQTPEIAHVTCCCLPSLLQLFGQFQPFPGLTVSSMTLNAVKNVGLQASASGTLASIPVSVRGEVTSVQGSNTKTTSLILTAANVGVGALLREVFDSADVPKFITDFVAPIKFSSVMLTYNSAATGRARFGFAAVPDMSGVPALQAVVEAIGLDPTDIALRMGPSSLQFGISKSYQVQLPAPFTGPGVTTFNLAVDTATQGFVLAGSFRSALRIGGLRDDIGISIAASIGVAARSGLALSFAGSTTSSIVIRDFPWVRFGTFTLAASVSVKPPVINQLTLAGSVTLLGATSSALFNFDKNSGAITFASSLERLDLQQMIRAVGVNFDLGKSSLAVTSGFSQWLTAFSNPFVMRWVCVTQGSVISIMPMPPVQCTY